MDKYGLIGYPLGHSFSISYFNQKFADEGINAKYMNFEISSLDELEGVISSNPELKGINVTIPYKEKVMHYLDSITPEARAIGAVNVINAARDLGAGEFQTFTKIILPLSLPGVISGITMVFVPSLTTFVISDLLGGSKILLIGNVIEQKFKQGSNWNVGSGLSLVLMVFILISMAIMQKYDKDGEGAAF